MTRAGGPLQRWCALFRRMVPFGRRGSLAHYRWRPVASPVSTALQPLHRGAMKSNMAALAYLRTCHSCAMLCPEATSVADGLRRDDAHAVVRYERC